MGVEGGEIDAFCAPVNDKLSFIKDSAGFRANAAGCVGAAICGQLKNAYENGSK